MKQQKEGDTACCWLCELFWGVKMKLCVYEAAFVRFPSVFVSDSEMRVQRAEQRALKAEEALQLASVKIQDLERKLQSSEGTEPQTWN